MYRHTLWFCLLSPVLTPGFAQPETPVNVGTLPTPEQDRQARQIYSFLTKDPKRDAWQLPDQVVGALAFRPGETVVTIGDQGGYLSRRIAPQVRRVFILNDDSKALIKAAAEEPVNVDTQQSQATTPNFKSTLADTIVVYNKLSTLTDRSAYYAGLSSALKANGRIAVIDFYKKPPPGLPAVRQVTATLITSEMKTAGFRLVGSYDFLPFQYFLVFQH